MSILNDCAPVSSLEVIDPSLTISITVSAGYVESNGVQQPALLATWSAITSPYIAGVQFQYGPSDMSSGPIEQNAQKAALSWSSTNSIVATGTYTEQHRAIGSAPNTFGPWSTPTNYTVPAAPPITDGDLSTTPPADVSGTPTLSIATTLATDGTEVSYLTTGCTAVSGAAGYDVDVNDGATTWTEWSPTNSLKNLRVVSGKTYKTRFKAMSRTGLRSANWSSWSADVLAAGKTTKPPAVISGSVTAIGGRRLRVIQKRPVMTDYGHTIIYRNTTGFSPDDVPQSPYTIMTDEEFIDINVTVGSNYRFWGRTVDRSGNEADTATFLGNAAPVFTSVGGGDVSPTDPDLVGARAGTNLFRTDGTTVLTQAEVRTIEGIADSVVGQGDLALMDNIGWTSGLLTGRPALTQGNSLTEDPGMSDISAWNLSGCHLYQAVDGAWAGAIVNDDNVGGAFSGARTVPVDANKTYLIEGSVYTSSSGSPSAIYGGVDVQTASGVSISGDGTYWLYNPAAASPALGSTTHYSKTFGAGTDRPLPSTATTMRVIGFPNYGNVAGALHYFYGWRIVEVVRIGANLFRADGTVATEGAIVTSLGVADSVTGQGDLALQDTVTWGTQVVGSGRPSDNAGTSGVLTAIGNYTTITGNTVLKRGGTHGSFQGAARGSAQRGTAFISSRLLQPVTAGGWETWLALDESPTTLDRVYSKFGAAFTGGVTPYVNIVVNGSGGGSVSVPWATQDSVMTLAYDGTSVSIFVDGVRTHNQSAAPGLVLWPKVLDYYSSGDYLSYGIRDVLYGAWTENTVSSAVLVPYNTEASVAGNTTTKTGGSNGNWGAGASSREKYTGSAYCEFRVGASSQPYFMAGLASSSFAGDYSSIEYSCFTQGLPASEAMVAYGAGVGSLAILAAAGAWSLTDVWAVVYDGVRVQWLQNGVVRHTRPAAAGQTLGFASSQVYIGNFLTDIQVGVGPQVARVGYNTYDNSGGGLLSRTDLITIEGVADSVVGQTDAATAPNNRVFNERLENGVRFIPRPDGGSLNLPSPNQTGQIEIVLPFAATNSMLSFRVVIYDYSVGRTVEYLIGGYTYTNVTPADVWYNVSAQYIGPRDFSRPVKFGAYGTHMYVWIGNVGDLWQYPVITVEDLRVGFGNQSLSWESGWIVQLNNSNIGSLVSSTINVPRAGDQVFGEGLLEVAGGAVATLGAFKTILGVADSVTDQGVLATSTLSEDKVQGRFLGEHAGDAAAITAGIQNGDTYIDSSLFPKGLKTMRGGVISEVNLHGMTKIYEPQKDVPDLNWTLMASLSVPTVAEGSFITACWTATIESTPSPTTVGSGALSCAGSWKIIETGSGSDRTLTSGSWSATAAGGANVTTITIDAAGSSTAAASGVSLPIIVPVAGAREYRLEMKLNAGDVKPLNNIGIRLFVQVQRPPV